MEKNLAKKSNIRIGIEAGGEDMMKEIGQTEFMLSLVLKLAPSCCLSSPTGVVIHKPRFLIALDRYPMPKP